MNQPNQKHPGEDALERFVLHQSSENEIAIVETHSLCCDLCLDRLEMLDIEIAATKHALRTVLNRQSAGCTAILACLNPTFHLRHVLGATAAVAACLVGVVLASMPSRVTLVATRGSETSIVNTWRPLDLRLNVRGLDQGPVIIRIAGHEGKLIWQTKANVDGQEDLIIRVPRIWDSGIYFVRICALRDEQELREFVLRVQSPL